MYARSQDSERCPPHPSTQVFWGIRKIVFRAELCAGLDKYSESL